MHTQHLEAANLQDITAVKYNTDQLSPYFIPIFSYLIAMLISCCSLSVEYLLHMQLLTFSI